MIRLGGEYGIALGGYILAHPAAGGLENKLSISLA